MTNKMKLRSLYLKPKIKLRGERRAKEYTTAYMANLVGLERRQYEKREAGEFPFKDYEMEIISKELNIPVGDLFF